MQVYNTDGVWVVGLIVPILSYCSLWWDGMVVLLVYERQYYCSDLFLISIPRLTSHLKSMGGLKVTTLHSILTPILIGPQISLRNSSRN